MDTGGDLNAVDRVAALSTDIARRAATLALGGRRDEHACMLFPPLRERVEAAEQRARGIVDAGGDCTEARRGAALEFLAAAATAVALDPDSWPGDAGAVVAETAKAIGCSRNAACLSVFLRAPATPEALALPPTTAAQLVVRLLVELGPADAASLWTTSETGRLECVASAGAASKSRRLRTAGRGVLVAEPGTVTDWRGHVRGVSVPRWDAAHAALVARCRPDVVGDVDVFLDEASVVLSHLFEQEMLFAQNADREHALVSASERRLTRLGCDLHDGPLQDIVALAEELRYTRKQISALLDDDLLDLVRGRFDDVEARLESLDHGLRQISHSVRATSAVDQPLQDAIGAEVDAMIRMGTKTQLTVDGHFSALTASQKIVLFRVVQEALSNVRRHSHADNVRVRLHSAGRYVAVTVSDDGCGFDVEAAARSGRLGLTGLVQRVRLLGGDIEIDSAAGRGTRVRAVLPRWSPAPAQSGPLYAVSA